MRYFLYSPVPELVNDKNITILRSEIEKMQTELRIKTQDFNTLTNKFSELENKYDEAEKLKKTAEKSYQTQIAQLKNQLVGAIRRINYLVEEKKKTNSESKKRSNYLSRIELEYAKSKENAKNLTQKIYCLTQKDQKQTYSIRQRRESCGKISEFRNESTESIRALKEKNMQGLREIEKELQNAKSEMGSEAQIDKEIEKYVNETCKLSEENI